MQLSQQRLNIKCRPIGALEISQSWRGSTFEAIEYFQWEMVAQNVALLVIACKQRSLIV